MLKTLTWGSSWRMEFWVEIAKNRTNHTHNHHLLRFLICLLLISISWSNINFATSRKMCLLDRVIFSNMKGCTFLSLLVLLSDHPEPSNKGAWNVFSLCQLMSLEKTFSQFIETYTSWRKSLFLRSSSKIGPNHKLSVLQN